MQQRTRTPCEVDFRRISVSGRDVHELIVSRDEGVGGAGDRGVESGEDGELRLLLEVRGRCSNHWLGMDSRWRSEEAPAQEGSFLPVMASPALPT